MYYVIPPKVKRNAITALNMRKEGFKGGTETGINRGKQLSREDYISMDDVVNMRAWFARHRKVSRPGYSKWKKEGKPTIPRSPADKTAMRGSVAWLLWGGDEGEKWVNSII